MNLIFEAFHQKRVQFYKGCIAGLKLWDNRIAGGDPSKNANRR